MCSQGAVKQQTRQGYLGTFFRVSAFKYKFPCLMLCPLLVSVKKKRHNDIIRGNFTTLVWKFPLMTRVMKQGVRLISNQ